MAVLIKQVPEFESMALRADGRLRREGLTLEINPFCRRAISTGIDLARAHHGRCTVLTLGPTSAEDALREAVACGADDAVLITDPEFAGSDTLATARALAAALRAAGPYDLVLVGRNSVDADTGQVGPQVAQMLELPFLGGVRELELDAETGELQAQCELDDGWAAARVQLPAVLSCAERLCSPAKAGQQACAEVSRDRIRQLSAFDLGAGPWGEKGSPTRVGPVRTQDVNRTRRLLTGGVDTQVAAAVELLLERGTLDPGRPGRPPVEESVPANNPLAQETIAVVIEPSREAGSRELLGVAATLAGAVDAVVVALDATECDARRLASWGADEIVRMDGSPVAEDVARALHGWCDTRRPWAMLGSGSMWGRETMARLAARLGAGLTGDAVALTVADGRLIGWKPAFGGRLVAAVTSDSAVQLVTVRPGIVEQLAPRALSPTPAVSSLHVESQSRVCVLSVEREAEPDELIAASAVVGVGRGVDPSDYRLVNELCDALGAEVAATRKVTDSLQVPRARQVGITGHSIGPRLYVAVGISGRYNHVIGVNQAATILAVNSDPSAAIFDASDIGIVGDYRQVLPRLTTRLREALPEPPARRGCFRLRGTQDPNIW